MATPAGRRTYSGRGTVGDALVRRRTPSALGGRCRVPRTLVVGLATVQRWPNPSGAKDRLPDRRYPGLISPKAAESTWTCRCRAHVPVLTVVEAGHRAAGDDSDLQRHQRRAAARACDLGRPHPQASPPHPDVLRRDRRLTIDGRHRDFFSSVDGGWTAVAPAMYAAWRRRAGMTGNPESVGARQTRALQDPRAGSIEA